MTHLLDTNVCIAVMRGHTGVQSRMKTHSPSDLGVSTVTLYELCSGIARCRSPELEQKKLEVFLEPLHILPFDSDAAIHAARVRWELQRKGIPIGPYDLQLAGQALALDAILVTHNTSEFHRVKDLRLEDWEA